MQYTTRSEDLSRDGLRDCRKIKGVAYGFVYIGLEETWAEQEWISMAVLECH